MLRAGSWVNSLATAVVLSAASIVAAQPLPAFTTRMEISTAVNDPTFIRTVDFDGDGDQDIVSTGQNVTRLLLSDGAPIPSFVEVIVWSFTGGGANVAVGDLDGDGDLDVISSINAVIGANPAAGVYWHENLGGNPPAFTTQLVITGFSDWIELADVNGDTKIDIIITQSPTNDVVCFLQDPLTPGAFSPPVPLIAGTMDVRAVNATDLDGDGDLDLVLSATFDKAIRWLENIDGSGVNYIQRDIFVSQAPSATASKISIVDFDGDQRPDILSTWGTEDLIRLHRNLGGSPAAFDTTDVGAATAPQIAFGADMDGDTFTDIVSISSEDDSVRFWRNLNTAPPTFAEEVVTSAANMGRTLSLADMDGDADLDIVSGSAFDEAIRWYRNDSDLAVRVVFSERLVAAGVFGAAGASTGVFTPSGRPDIAITDTQQGGVSLYRNLGGDPPPWGAQTLTPGVGFPVRMVNADIDSDGLLDVVVSSFFNLSLLLYRNLGGDPPTFAQSTLPTPSVSTFFAVVDLDQDGDLDIVATDAGDSSAWLVRNDGASPPSFTSEVLFTPAQSMGIGDAGDVDGDGDPDLVGVRLVGGSQSQVLWWENVSVNPAQPTFVERIAILLTSPNIVRLADLDNDGDGDIIVGYGGGGVCWLESPGLTGGPFIQRVVNSGGGVQEITGVQSIDVADLGNDGDLDFATTHFYNDGVRLHENLGGPTPQFITHIVTNQPDGGRGVGLADFNGDGQLDLASVDDTASTINWHENLFHLPADLNDDGLVNAADLASLLVGWGLDQGFGADLTGDGIVNAADLAQLLVGWTP